MKEAGLDFQGLLPEQIQGFGLGVMAARARSCGQVLGIPQSSIRSMALTGPVSWPPTTRAGTMTGRSPQPSPPQPGT